MKKLEIMETKILVTPENDPRAYIGYNMLGFPFNKKYPPNRELYRDSFEGYSNKALGILLYDFCVMGYDVEFSYKGEPFFLLNTGEGIVSDSHFSER